FSRDWTSDVYSSDLDALGALARIAAIGFRREEVVREELVEHLGDFGRLALHHLVALRLEVAPERFEDRLPFGAPAGDVVELLLHFGGEVVGDVAGKEALEERGQQTPRILGEETVLLGSNIGAVAQGLDGRGVSRGSADPKLLEPLDEARLGKARRRLREVLIGGDAELGRRVALAHPRQQA